MDIKDINDQVTDIKNLPFLINFLNHCNITGVPPLTYLQSQNIVANANATLSEIFQNQTNVNLVNKEFIPSDTANVQNRFQDLTAISFATLLSTNSSFALTMQDVVYAYNQDPSPGMSILKSVLQNNMSDIYAGLFQRVQNGETLTAENVNSAISGGLLSKKESIKSEVLLLTSTGMKIPKAALEQRMKGIRWQPIKGGTLSNKDIERVKKTTEIIKKSLEQSRTAIQTAKNFVQLLKILESIYSKGFIKILQMLVKKIFSFFRDVGSSGFYLLNMTEPYLKEGLFTNGIFYGDKNKEKAGEKQKLIDRIGKARIASDYEYLLNDFRSTTPHISDYTIQDVEESGRNRLLNNNTTKDTADWLKSVSTFYKPTTYASFIRTIADAFLDEADLPSEGTGFTIPLVKYEVKDTTGQIGSEQIKGYIKRENDPAENWRTGRPIFSDGSNSTVMIIAFSAPDVVNLGLTAVGAVEAFVDFFDFFIFGKSKQSELFAWFYDKKADRTMKRINRVFENFNFRRKRSKLYDYYKKPPYIDEKGDIQVPNDASQYPDFYGASIRGFFPNLFAELDELEARTNKLLLDAKSSLSKSLDKLLKNIEEALDDLEDLIDLLDRIIGFFEALQTMGLYTLQITSNGGNEDIVEKLLAAEGFPGVEEGDKLRWIGGFVVCYGLPSPNLNGFDFAAYAKQQYAMMNYLAASEKFAIYGEEDMDPGSFEDYMMDENIGPIDYNSSLDKIFKKIF